jgi:tetratricopeptide (TPR) repeat protein
MIRSSGETKVSELDELKFIVSRSVELSQSGEYQEALKIIDEAIARAAPQKKTLWAKVLSRHAVAIARSARDDDSIRRFCEQIIRYDPDDATARYVLADVLLRQEQVDLARQQALMSYAAAERSNSPEGRGIIELILKTWPEIASR